MNKKYSSPTDHFLSRYSWFNNSEKNEFLKNNLSNKNFDEYSLMYMSLFLIKFRT